jgi:hypothetical protein
MAIVPYPPVGDVKANVPLIEVSDAVPLKIKPPKLSCPVTVPLPLPLVPVRVPMPDPTEAEVNVKLMVFPETVPEAVPVCTPAKPKMDRSMSPVPPNVVELCVKIAFIVPETPYLVSVHVPDHVPVVTGNVPDDDELDELDDEFDELDEPPLQLIRDPRRKIQNTNALMILTIFMISPFNSYAM